MANTPKKSKTKTATADSASLFKVKPTPVLARSNFKALLLANANYFGNLAGSTLKPVLNIQGDTTYENIACVGYNPQVKRLEAVVYINQDSGYDGDICSNGSQEFVRFYLSYDNGATWQDQGMTTFTVYDVPGPKPLEYDATLNINPPEGFCFFENLPKARAILSWNNPIPANQPNWTPIWGNVVDVQIQIAGFTLIPLKDLFSELKVSVAEKYAGAIDLLQPVKAAEPKALTSSELTALYKGKNIPPHRYLAAELTKAIGATVVHPPKAAFLPQVTPPPPAFAFELTNLAAILESLFGTSGNTTYEQLDCVGLNPNNSQLAGVIHLKRASGYSGGPCSAGSQEYVAFWVDWGDGSGFNYVGTTSVTVHDYSSITADGLRYSVFLPLDMTSHGQLCDAGPKTARVRAVLSWNTPPSTTDPNASVTWGNSVDTTILVTPGPTIGPGLQIPFLSRAGDIDESKIDGNGRITDAYALETGAHFVDAPFGGLVTLAGFISNPVPGLKYRIMKKPHGASDTLYAPIIVPGGLTLTLDQFTGVIWTQTQITETPDSDGYYVYQNYSANHAVEANIMGKWYTTSADTGNAYDLRIDLSVDGNPAHDAHSNVVTILVDNDAPNAQLSLTLGGECGKFSPGDTITGTFTATDDEFGAFSFVILPPGPAHGVLPSPASGSSTWFGGAIADPGVSGQTFNLDTHGMDPCGYSMTLYVSDRTNVNSGQTNNWNSASVGFCLEAPGT